MTQQEHEKVRSLRRILESTLDSKDADLSQLVQCGCLRSFANEMFSATLISGEVKKQPDFDKIVGEFKAKMLFIDTQSKLEEHCYKLLMVLKKLGGPLIEAANVLEQLWVDTVWSQLKIRLTIMRPSQANDQPQNTNNYLQYLTQQQRRSSQSGYQSTIQHRVPPPAEMPRSSHDINSTLRQFPQHRDELLTMAAMILYQYGDQSNETLEAIWSQQVSQTTPQQSFSHRASTPSALHFPQTLSSHQVPHNDSTYSYDEAQQSTQDLNSTNSTWGLTRQQSHTATVGHHGTMYNDKVVPLTDPSVMVRGSSLTHSNLHVPCTDGHSDMVPGSNILNHTHLFPQQSNIPVSRSSTDDTMTPLQSLNLSERTQLYTSDSNHSISPMSSNPSSSYVQPVPTSSPSHSENKSLRTSTHPFGVRSPSLHPDTTNLTINGQDTQRMSNLSTGTANTPIANEQNDSVHPLTSNATFLTKPSHVYSEDEISSRPQLKTDSEGGGLRHRGHNIGTDILSSMTPKETTNDEISTVNTRDEIVTKKSTLPVTITDNGSLHKELEQLKHDITLLKNDLSHKKHLIRLLYVAVVCLFIFCLLLLYLIAKLAGKSIS